MRGNTSGWFKESYRHSLAARGVTTSYFARKPTLSMRDEYRTIGLRLNLLRQEAFLARQKAKQLKKAAKQAREKKDFETAASLQLDVQQEKARARDAVARMAEQQNVRAIIERSQSGVVGREVPSQRQFVAAYQAALQREGKSWDDLTKEQKTELLRGIAVERSQRSLAERGGSLGLQAIGGRKMSVGKRERDRAFEVQRIQMFGAGPYADPVLAKEIVRTDRAERAIRRAQEGIARAGAGEQERGPRGVFGTYDRQSPGYVTKIRVRDKEGRLKRVPITGVVRKRGGRVVGPSKRLEAIQKREAKEMSIEDRKVAALQYAGEEYAVPTPVKKEGRGRVKQTRQRDVQTFDQAVFDRSVDAVVRTLYPGERQQRKQEQKRRVRVVRGYDPPRRRAPEPAITVGALQRRAAVDVPRERVQFVSFGEFKRAARKQVRQDAKEEKQSPKYPVPQQMM
jgi:hypothetical protein